MTPDGDWGGLSADQGQPHEPGRGKGYQHHQGDLHLVFDPVDGEAHDSGEGALAEDGDQANHANILVLDAKRSEVIHHHTQPGTKNALNE